MYNYVSFVYNAYIIIRYSRTQYWMEKTNKGIKFVHLLPFKRRNGLFAFTSVDAFHIESTCLKTYKQSIFIQINKYDRRRRCSRPRRINMKMQILPMLLTIHICGKLHKSMWRCRKHNRVHVCTHQCHSY